MTRWLGVDYGQKRIGLALGGEELRLAAPLTTVPATSELNTNAERIADMATRERARGIVVGLPLNMDGSCGPQAETTLAFVRALQQRFHGRVETWDERLSSFQADQSLAQMQLTKKRAQARRDAIAATVILQAFLDAHAPKHDGTDAADAT